MPTATGHTRAIRASRVIGTDVFDASGESLGTVEDVVLDKTSPEIMFAVVRNGAVLVAADSYFPLPWAMLDFDERLGGYVLRCSKDQLASAPSYSMLPELIENDGEAPRAAAHRHFGPRKGS